MRERTRGATKMGASFQVLGESEWEATEIQERLWAFPTDSSMPCMHSGDAFLQWLPFAPFQQHLVAEQPLHLFACQGPIFSCRPLLDQSFEEWPFPF